MIPHVIRYDEEVPTKKSPRGTAILPIFVGAVAEVLIEGVSIRGGMSVMGQRKSAVGDDTWGAEITKALRTRKLKIDAGIPPAERDRGDGDPGPHRDARVQGRSRLRGLRLVECRGVSPQA